MKIFKKVIGEVTKVDDVKCDLCEKSCKHYVYKAHANFNYAKVISEFGYGSKLDGMEFEEKYICEDCYLEIFDTKK